MTGEHEQGGCIPNTKKKQHRELFLKGMEQSVGPGVNSGCVAFLGKNGLCHCLRLGSPIKLHPTGGSQHRQHPLSRCVPTFFGGDVFGSGDHVQCSYTLNQESFLLFFIGLLPLLSC